MSETDDKPQGLTVAPRTVAPSPEAETEPKPNVVYVQRKLTLSDMEAAVCTLLTRMHDAEGQPCARVDLQVSPELIFSLQSVRQFLTWAVPHEAEIRKVGHAARKKTESRR